MNVAFDRGAERMICEGKILPSLLAAAVLGATASSAHAATIHVPLASSIRDQLTSIEVIISISQDRLYYYVPPADEAAIYPGMAMALGDAVVNNLRASSAAKTLTPLTDVLSDFNFDASLEDGAKELNAIRRKGACRKGLAATSRIASRTRTRP